jgi:hypothetical protein
MCRSISWSLKRRNLDQSNCVRPGPAAGLGLLSGAAGTAAERKSDQAEEVIWLGLPMYRMFCYCGVALWMHFRFEYGSYRPYFTLDQNQAKLIDCCPGCGASLNLMVAHLESAEAPDPSAATIHSAMAVLAGESERLFSLPAVSHL